MPDRQSVADAFNRLFELGFDWSYRGDLKCISLEEIQEMSRLFEIIAQEISKNEMQNALWALQMNKFHVAHAIKYPSTMKKFPLNDAQKADLQENIMHSSLKKPYGAEIHFGFPSTDFRDILEESQKEIMIRFYLEEQHILHQAGLNQASIATILNRLKHFETPIISNICRSKSVLTGKYLRAISSTKTFIERLQASKRVVRGHAELDSSSNHNLLRTKDKVIGLATLWGDAIPLLTKQDWGIASVISSTAAATVAVFYN